MEMFREPNSCIRCYSLYYYLWYNGKILSPKVEKPSVEMSTLIEIVDIKRKALLPKVVGDEDGLRDCCWKARSKTSYL